VTDQHVTTDWKYAPIPEAVLYSDLSGTAVKVYGCLLRHGLTPDSCYPSHARIARLIHISPRSVQRPLRELEEAGWIRRIPRFNPGGEQTSDGFHVFTAQQNAQGASTSAAQGASTSAAYPASMNAPKESKIEREQDERESLASHAQLALVPTPPPAGAKKNDYPEDFEKFWKTYPRRDAKGEALRQWREACKRTTPQALIDAAAAHARAWDAEGRAKQYIPQAQKWLRRWYYDDEPEVLTPSHGTNGRAAANDAVLREFALAHGVNPEIMSPEAMYGLPPSRKEIG
jgi:hypothetical protein